MFEVVENFTRDVCQGFAQMHKSEGMLLQYSGAALSERC